MSEIKIVMKWQDVDVGDVVFNRYADTTARVARRTRHHLFLDVSRKGAPVELRRKDGAEIVGPDRDDVVRGWLCGDEACDGIERMFRRRAEDRLSRAIRGACSRVPILELDDLVARVIATCEPYGGA